MPGNYNIALGVQAPKIDSPINALANVLQVKSAQQQNQIGQMKMDEYGRGVERQNKLREILQGTDPAQLNDALLRGGFMEESQARGKYSADLAKTQADTGKVQADTKASQVKQAIDRLQHGSSVLSTAKDQQTYDIALQTLAQSFGPESIAKMPPQFDPQVVAAKLAEGQTITQKLASENSAATLAQTVTRDTMTNQRGIDDRTSREREAAAGRGVTMRGQNMTDARARLTATGEQGKPPAGYRRTADGNLEAIPGGPADKGATASEGERKAATLLQRLEFSSAQLDKARKDKPGATTPNLLSNGLDMIGMEAAANSVQSGERQRVEAAQLDMLDAALTLGTGAAYTKEQLKGYAKSYFPQIGDDKTTVADKDKRLKNVIDAAKIAAGRAGKQVNVKPEGSWDSTSSNAAFDAADAIINGKK